MTSHATSHDPVCCGPIEGSVGPAGAVGGGGGACPAPIAAPGSWMGAMPFAGASAGAPPRPPPRASPVLLVVGLYSKFVATAYCELLLAEVGMYIRFKVGLKDIGAQLWPPPGPGMIVMV